MTSASTARRTATRSHNACRPCVCRRDQPSTQRRDGIARPNRFVRLRSGFGGDFTLFDLSRFPLALNRSSRMLRHPLHIVEVAEELDEGDFLQGDGDAVELLILERLNQRGISILLIEGGE